MQSKRKLILIAGAVVIVLVMAGAAIYAYLNSENNGRGLGLFDTMSAEEMKQQEKDMSATRDDIRRQHAITFASQLVKKVLIQKETLSYTEKDAALIMKDDMNRPILDPFTGRPYTFSLEQNMMQPGEMTFRVGGTCDDKKAKSDDKDPIVGARSVSVAVALKLENGGFACESNL